MPLHIFVRVLLACLGASAFSPAFAQAYPDKPIRFVMSAPAGSSIDTLGRTIADKLKDRLGQPVIVENKPAAGGTVATGEVAKAAPDGYTMVLAFNGPLSITPLLSKVPYDVQKDLAPVIITSSQPNVLAVTSPKPIRASSISRRSAAEARRTSMPNCSRLWPESTSCTFRSTARRRP